METITLKYGIPVSVIVPLQEKRKEFFYQFVLPLLKANQPAEIIIHDGEGNAAKKRNEGFAKSTNPLVCFCDDDKLLGKDYLKTLYSTLYDFKFKSDFVYTGYTGIVMHESHPCKTNYKIETKDFNMNDLKISNYIDTTSLIRRGAFPGFDETLEQHEDWDLYLRMATNGAKGVAVHGLQFFSFYIDEGISSKNNKDCTAIIKNRYK